MRPCTVGKRLSASERFLRLAGELPYVAIFTLAKGTCRYVYSVYTSPKRAPETLLGAPVYNIHSYMDGLGLAMADQIFTVLLSGAENLSLHALLFN